MDRYKSLIKLYLNFDFDTARVFNADCLYLLCVTKGQALKIKSEVRRMGSTGHPYPLRSMVCKGHVKGWYIVIVEKNGNLKMFTDDFIINRFVDLVKANG